MAEIEKVVIIAADLAGLDADAGVFESGERRESLREEAGLDVLGDFEFVGGAALGFLLCYDNAALLFHRVGQLVEADEREGIAVDIAEAGDDSAPDGSFFAEEHAVSAGDAGVCTFTCTCDCRSGGTCGCRGGLLGLRLVANAFEARRSLEADASLRPFLEFCGDIFGNEDDLRRTADQLVLLGARLGSDKGKDGGAVGRGYADPAFAGLHASVVGDVEAELVDEEAKAAVLIADEDVNAVKAQVRGRRTRREGAHGQDYKAKSGGLGQASENSDRLVALEWLAVKAWFVSRVSVCENVGARNHEHIAGQACHADEAGRFREVAGRRRNHLHDAGQGGELGAQELNLAVGIWVGVLRD